MLQIKFYVTKVKTVKYSRKCDRFCQYSTIVFTYQVLLKLASRIRMELV
jgi:hypothetical protein